MFGVLTICSICCIVYLSELENRSRPSEPEQNKLRLKVRLLYCTWAEEFLNWVHQSAL